MSGLPFLPKVALSVVILLLTFVFLYLVWTPPLSKAAKDSGNVIEAYNRMQRVLARLGQTKEGRPTIDGVAVEKDWLAKDLENYLAVAEFVKANPGHFKGAYEVIWDHGGESRAFTDDTDAFETIVSAFFYAYQEAEKEAYE